MKLGFEPRLQPIVPASPRSLLNPSSPVAGKGSLSLRALSHPCQTPAQDSEGLLTHHRLTPPTCGAPDEESHVRWTDPLSWASLVGLLQGKPGLWLPLTSIPDKVTRSSSAKDVGLSRTNQKEKTEMILPQGHISPAHVGPLPQMSPPCLTLCTSQGVLKVT